MTVRLNKTQPESWPLDAPELAEDNPHALHEHGPRTRAVPGSNLGGPIASQLSSVFPYAECRYVWLVGAARCCCALAACVVFRRVMASQTDN